MGWKTLQRIGNFQIVKKIAQGGSAEVFLAEDIRDSNLKYAIKKLRPEFSYDVDFIRLLQSEYQTLRRFKHPNIVAAHAFHSEGENHYCVLEYIEGYSLHRLLEVHEKRGQAFPEPVAIQVTEQIADALEFIHRHSISEHEPMGLLHSDLNPKNFILNRQGQIKLIDFSSQQAEENRRIDPHGMGRGIIDYMSPEQLEGKGIDARSEVFSTGILCYEMLLGSHPFPGDSAFEVYRNIRAKPITSKDIPGDIDTGLKNILAMALAKNPQDRYPDMRTFHRQLQDVLAANHPDFSPQDIALWLGKNLFPTS